MLFREAQITDIQQIQKVRHSVKENILSNPDLVTDKDCEEYLTQRGKGWVCEINEQIVGFAIADLIADNIWALFVSFDFEAKGIGKKLHHLMLNWYFSQNKEKVWLSTTPNTRASMFYHKLGWKEVGTYGACEIKFEMTFTDWQCIQNK